jgi:flagellar hook assembly protein FlgD
VTLKIYNLLGQEIATIVNEHQKVGFYNVPWHGRNQAGNTVATGVYFYRIEANPIGGGESFINLKKMILLK